MRNSSREGEKTKRALKRLCENGIWWAFLRRAVTQSNRLWCSHVKSGNFFQLFTECIESLVAHGWHIFMKKILGNSKFTGFLKILLLHVVQQRFSLRCRLWIVLSLIL
jgi:hypothetical protein